VTCCVNSFGFSQMNPRAMKRAIWQIRPATRSTGLTGMKQPFSARPVKYCLLLDALDRRKRQERGRRFRIRGQQYPPADGRDDYWAAGPTLYTIDAKLGRNGRTSLRALGIEIANNRDWCATTRDHSDKRVADPQDRQRRRYHHRSRQDIAVSVKPRGARFPARSDAARCGRLNPDRTASED
jgi:hypothetical protein